MKVLGSLQLRPLLVGASLLAPQKFRPLPIFLPPRTTFFSAPFLTPCWQNFAVPLLYLVSLPPSASPLALPQKLPNK
ncbi:MAG: hypothetical protein EBY81_06265 [Verrucomicrobia bacterium]|nr:hypothetical protein [Verrucomicrobiota bacterium]